jgi:hypothetical protein
MSPCEHEPDEWRKHAARLAFIAFIDDFDGGGCPRLGATGGGRSCDSSALLNLKFLNEFAAI